MSKLIKKSSVVKPSIVSNDDKKHVLIDAIDQNPGNEPVLRSIGMAKLPGTNQYISYVIETRGNEVISINVEEPNVKSIAVESTKISFVTEFMDSEE